MGIALMRRNANSHMGNTNYAVIIRLTTDIKPNSALPFSNTATAHMEIGAIFFMSGNSNPPGRNLNG